MTAAAARTAGRPGGPRIALCHEWLVHRYGSEKTFEAMAAALPEADLYALTRDRSVPFSFGSRDVRTTFLDRLEVLRTRRDLQLPLMPLAWRYASSDCYELVVTSSHACAKGFFPARSAVHLCYCYTPMRYLWLSSVDARRRTNPGVRAVEWCLKRWDESSIRWVDEFAAISTAVQERIQNIYGRPARVIHPPVETDFFTPGPEQKDDFALVVSRMVPYKRIDVAIRACKALDYRLVVAGSGPEEPALRRLASELAAPVSFAIAPDDQALRDLYRRARVLIFPAEEDFGIVTVEAQACGTPVVALGRGGSLDTVIAGSTGVLVAEQTVESFTAALQAVLQSFIDATACRRQAERFSAARFRREFVAWVEQAAEDRGLVAPVPVRQQSPGGL